MIGFPEAAADSCFENKSRIQNPVKHLTWISWCFILLQKAFQMFDCVLNTTQNFVERKHLRILQKFLQSNSEEYSEPSQIRRWSILQKSLTIFAKHSILDVRQGSEYASGNCSVEHLQIAA